MTTEKKFALQADLTGKQISFDKGSEHAYGRTTEGDANTGIVVGDNAVLVVDTQGTRIWTVQRHKDMWQALEA